ncbi:P-loop NTPase fold protein [Lacrimispora sp.]|uniref:KAP family P-loop NTPase fold protein n=1 Tax=Lacrimispora sp. TaxID=2719234 RepID=UPI0034606EE7
MWNDVETTQDFLNFSVIAETVAELIVESGEKPISIGVSGSWGAGKSSMVKMIGKALRTKDSDKGDEEKNYVFLEFNAWLYQGYDDARAALLQAVSDKLLEECKKRSSPTKNLTSKVKGFISRINWLQVAKMTVPLSMGLVPGGVAVGGIASLIGSVTNLIQNKDDETQTEKSEAVSAALEDLTPDMKALLKENASKSTPQQIEKIRAEFAELLKDLNITLVILVDDLDRCLPSTAISTLEAMRLLLFVERTAFIIAADEQMIRNSVKAHFADVELSEGLVTSYFDKLIQIPLSVPHLGITEVKIYLVMLFAELLDRRSEINSDSWEKVKVDLLSLLSNAWQGGISKEKIEEVFDSDSIGKMQEYIDMAEQLAGIMVTAEHINGNPRLIKRFLNNLIIRDKVARLNGMSLEMSGLVKMQLFERCASPAAFEFLVKKSVESKDGKLVFLQEIEAKLESGDDYETEDSNWKTPFINEWLKLEPKLGNMDIRPLLYLSRDRSLSLAAYDELSQKASEIFAALTSVDKDILNELVDRIKEIGETEAEKLLVRLGRVGSGNQWERKTFIASLHITKAYPNLGSRFVNILDSIPAKARKPTFIPQLRKETWASEMLTRWQKDQDTPQTVKNAITPKGGK